MNKVARILAGNLGPSFSRGVFERRLLSRVSINPSHVSVLNDVFVVPIESNYLPDVKAASQLICRAVGQAYSSNTIEPTVFDFSCTYPPPKFLGGNQTENPVAMTVAVRVARRKRNAIAIHFVTRDAEHGKSICSGQQLFAITNEPLDMSGEEGALASIPAPPPITEVGSDGVISDNVDAADEGGDDSTPEVVSKLKKPAGALGELRLLPTEDSDGMVDEYADRQRAKREAEEAARLASPGRTRKPRLPAAQSASVGADTKPELTNSSTVEFVDEDDDQ